MWMLISVKFYINWVFKQRVMHISSNEISSQNQLTIGEITHKFYIHTQALKFYQYGTNPTSYFNFNVGQTPTFTTPTIFFKQIQ